MTEIRLTENQRKAVETRGCSVLVSAAAGSGKTKVLVERLVAYVADPHDPKSIDSFLVITYTRAAAAQLRERIIEGINERAAAEPQNRRLRRQSALCYQARIGTIHSFCAALLRENCHLAGLAPDFRVIEEERADRMKESVLDRLLEQRYETIEEDDGFRLLVDAVGAGRDDSRLAALVMELHGKMLSSAWPRAWAERQKHALEAQGAEDIGETLWGCELLDNARERAEYWLGSMERCVQEIAGGDERLRKAYLPSFSATAEGLARLKNALGRGWDEARRALPVEFPRLGALRNGPEPETTARVKRVRERCKKAMEKMAGDFSDPSERLLRELRETAPAMRSLLEVTLRYDELYSKEKRRQGFVDFSDLEHMTLELLYDPVRETPTELAVELSSRFTEILVDEYQDVNEVQDLIFRCVSRGGNNLFMVGDVKQSIYRFRLADPTIFLAKYNSYAPEAEAEGNEPRRIVLSENFRSRGCIIDGANHIFRCIMSRRLGELDYDADAELRQGADYYDPGLDVPVSFEILPAPDGADEETPDKLTLEAKHTAARIRGLVESGAPVTENGAVRPAGYGDVVILLRSPGAAGKIYRRALVEAGIPAASEQGGGFFSSLEISTALSLLAVIDDPHQDIALISVLRSPIFGFSSDELADIRTADKNADFYSAMRARAQENGKCAQFLEMLDGLRALAPDLGVDELLRRLDAELDVSAIFSAMSDGSVRRENLFLLLEYARQFEENGRRGLFRFTEWMKKLEEKGEEPVAGSESGGAVRIMSIHKSKGLEFPYVFIPDTARRFNVSDSFGAVLVHSELGLGPKYADLERRVEYPTAAHRAISARIRRETLSEELRVLYVGATRAKERLFFSCVWKSPAERLKRLLAGLQGRPEPEVLMELSSFSEWIASAAAMDDSCISLTLAQPESVCAAEEETGAQPETADRELVSELERRLAFKYGHAAASALPSKLTATELKGRHEKDGEAQPLTAADGRRVFRMPDFARRSRPLTGAERGIAAHLVMQHMDLAAAGSRGALCEEIVRLRREGFLTQRQAEGVDPEMILRFFASETGRRMLAADSVRREFKFSLLCPAERFYNGAEGEELLLQGVVDCCIEENGELTIIDYKTDRVTAQTIAARAEHYRGQLEAYAGAMEQILRLPVKETVLFFLRSGQAVTVKHGGKK